MSTRSIIARVGEVEGHFTGRYCHSDGFPSWMGPRLFQLLKEKKNIKALLKFLIDEHKAGWSALGERCYCHPQDAKDNASDWHKRKPEPAATMTQEDLKDTDCQWLWAFDAENSRLYVRDIRHDAESIVDLNEPQPTEEQWRVIECGENFERCSHYAWAHGLLPRTSNLSTQAWLGNRPLDFHDAIAFVINGKRYTATGSGGSSDFWNTPLARQNGIKKSFPAHTWVASLKARNGARVDAAVAYQNGSEYTPLPGVVWIYPPTKTNPQESMVSAGGA